MTDAAGSSRSEASGRPFTFSPDNRRKLLARFGAAFDQAVPRGEAQRTRLLAIASCAARLSVTRPMAGSLADLTRVLQDSEAALHARQSARKTASIEQLRRDACEHAVRLLEHEVANHEGCFLSQRGRGGAELARLRWLMEWLPDAAQAAERLAVSLQKSEASPANLSPWGEVLVWTKATGAPLPNDPLPDTPLGRLQLATWYRHTRYMADALRTFASDVQQAYRKGGRPSDEAFVDLADVVLRVLRCCEVGAARNDRLFADVLRRVLHELIDRHPEIEREIPKDLAHVQRQARRRWASTAAATGNASRRVGAAARRGGRVTPKKPPRES